MRISILGAGAVGQALATLFVAGGHEVALGRRSGGTAPDGSRPVDLRGAAAHGELVVVAIPYSATPEVLSPLADALAGKVLIDATNPLGANWSPLRLGEANSAAQEIQRRLPRTKVVKAFNTVFAEMMRADLLQREQGRVAAFIASDHAEAAAHTAELAKSAGFNPVPTGPLSTAGYLEAMAHLNIAIAVGQGGGTRAAFVYSRSG